MQAPLTIAAPIVVGTFSAALNIQSLAQVSNLVFQVGQAASTDQFSVWGAVVSNATVQAQMVPLSGLGEINGPTPAASGGPVPYPFLYVRRDAGTTALTCSVGGQESPGTNSLNPAGAVVNTGNAFGSTFIIGSTDSQNIALVGMSAASTQGGTANLLLDSGTTGSVSMGTGAFSKAITIGNASGTTSIAIVAGTGNVTIANNATDHSTTLGSATGVSALTLQGGTGASVFTVQATGSLSLGANATDHSTSVGSGTGVSVLTLAGGTGTSVWTIAATGTLQLGANATDHTTTVGSVTGVSLTTVQGGTGGVAITGTGAGPIAITSGTGTSAWTIAATGTLNIGADANAHTISIGTGAAAQTVTVGSLSSTSTLTLQSGTGATGVTITAGTGTSAWTIGAAGTLNLANDANAHTVNVGTGAAAQTVTVGSTNSTSSLALKAGTGLVTVTGGYVNGGVVALGNMAAGGALTGGAAATVDITSYVTLAQTTGAQTITIPNPTTAQAGRMFYLLNIGSATFSCLGKTVAAQAANASQLLIASWDNTNTHWTTNI